MASHTGTVSAVSVGQKVGLGKVTLVLGFSALLSVIIGGFPVLLTALLGLSAVLLAQAAYEHERERSSAAKGYFLGVLSLVVGGLLLLPNPAEAAASTSETISRGSIIKDESWSLNAVRLHRTELGLLGADVKLLNSSDQTRSVTFSVNVKDADGGTQELVGTVHDVPSGAEVEVEALGASHHPKVYVNDFRVIAQY